MERDADLLEALLEIAERADGLDPVEVRDVPGWSGSAMRHHAQLVREAGYVRSAAVVPGGPAWIGALTWAGHNALDELRSLRRQ